MTAARPKRAQRVQCCVRSRSRKLPGVRGVVHPRVADAGGVGALEPDFALDGRALGGRKTAGFEGAGQDACGQDVEVRGGREVAADLTRDEDRGRVDIGVDLGRLRHDDAARHVDLPLESSEDWTSPSPDLSSKPSPLPIPPARVDVSAARLGSEVGPGRRATREARIAHSAMPSAPGKEPRASLSRGLDLRIFCVSLASPALSRSRGHSHGEARRSWSLTSPAASSARSIVRPVNVKSRRLTEAELRERAVWAGIWRGARRRF